MALSTKVGSLTSPAVTGTQAITGVGFTPKAIIFFTSGSDDVSGTWSGDIFQSIGYTTGPSDSYSVAGGSADGSGTSNTDRRIAAKAITLTNAGAALSEEADLSSFDADGFTLNWTTANSLQRNISYLVLGGTDITNAKVVKWTAPTSAINKAVTGVGFKPDLVLHAGAYGATSTDVNIPFTGSHHSFSFGAMNKHGQQWANGLFSVDALAANSDTQRSQQTDACIAETQGSLGWRVQAHYVSMDTDGFTVNFSTGAAGASDNHVFVSLALKGVSSKLGAFSKTTAVAPASQAITRTGFTPKALVVSSFSTTAQASPVSASQFNLGAASSASDARLAAQADLDATASTTVAKSIHYTGRIAAQIGGNPPSVNSLASLTSLDADGFTLNWTANDTSTATEQLYLALGDSGTATTPAYVRNSLQADATAFSNQRKLDRTQDGTLWAVADYDNATGTFTYSKDEGVTWTEVGSANILGFTNGSLFIDIDDYAHVVWKQNGTGGGRTDGYIYYMRGTPNATRTAWTWSSSYQVGNTGDTSRNYPDIIAHKEGNGWRAHIVVSFTNGSNINYTDYARFSVASDGSISKDTFTGIGSYTNAIHTFPSIDFNHIGDGKTIAGATPHLYAAWSSGATGAGNGIRFKKAVYSGGTWTWGTEQAIDTATYIPDIAHWINTLYDGSNRVIIPGWVWTGSQRNLILHEYNTSTDTVVPRTLVTGIANSEAPHAGSTTYDKDGNVYFFGTRNALPNDLIYRKWTRSGSTLSSVVSLDPIGGGIAYPAAKRGYSNNRIEWIYTSGNNSPYAVKYDYIATGGSSPSVTLSSPADGASTDLSTGPTFSWSFSDADSETQASYALRRRVQGTTEYEYWNATTIGWQAVLVYNSSTTASVTFPAEWWQGGTIYEWSVSAKDTGGATSAFATNRTVTNSAARSGVKTKVGSFGQGSATGNLAITGVGFKPKAIIFWFAGSQAASGTWDADVGQSMGFTDGTTSYAIGGFSWDAQTTPTSARRMSQTIYTVPDRDGTTVWQEATLVSLDSDGFTINRTTSNASFQGQQVCYMAIGGDDITSAKVVQWSANGQTGNQSITGVNSKPDLAFHAGWGGTGAIPSSSPTYWFQFGAMNKHGQQWANSIYTFDGSVASNSNTSRWQQTDACIAFVDSTETAYAQAHYASMDADGFTMNWSTTGSVQKYMTLCIRGISSKLGAFSKPQGNLAQTITGVGFTPKAALFTTALTDAQSGVPIIQAAHSVGASDGTNVRNTQQYDRDALATTQAKSVWRSDYAIGVPRDVATDNGLANPTFNSDGFSLAWVNSDATATTEILYMALGNAALGTVPQFVDSSTAATATAYCNQRKLDRTQNGNLWMTFWNGTSTTTASFEFWYSADGGATWTEDTAGRLGFAGTGTTYTPNASLFIAYDSATGLERAALVYKDRHDGFMYFRWGTPNVGRTAWTWSAATTVYNASINMNYPDVVSHREGTGWKIHIAASYADGAGSNHAFFWRYNVTSGESISNDGGTAHVHATANYGVTNVHTWPSIDFNHTGDGKTVKGGTPHLYAAWSAGTTGAGFGIRFKKATYSAGSWVWPDATGERQIDSTRRIDDILYRWLNCLFDGTRVIMVGNLLPAAGGNDHMLYERDAADTATTTTTLIAAAQLGTISGSATYDMNGNVYLIGRGANQLGLELAMYKWNRSSATLGPRQFLETTANSSPWVSAMRGYSNNLVAWVYTSGNNSPYSVMYGSVSTSGGTSTFERWGVVHV